MYAFIHLIIFALVEQSPSPQVSLQYFLRALQVYKYEVLYVEKVNFILAECREFFMTVKVKNVTLRSPKETFQIHAYKGPDGENIVRLCRRKLLVWRIQILNES